MLPPSQGVTRSPTHLACLVVACLLLVVEIASASADVVAVRVREGTSHGFPVLRSATDDKDLARGELVQVVRGDRVETRLTFYFKDGSLSDETTVFSQDKVLKLQSYRMVQRGPSFPGETEVSMDRASGHYRARRDDDTSEGKLEMPADVHNGMTGAVLKNLAPGASARGHLVAFTPKPYVLRSELTPEGEDAFFIGDHSRKATRYLIKLEISGLTGVIASLIGKTPPDLRYWISTGPAPGFLRFEGPMFLNGPGWRITHGAPRWSK